MKTSILIIAAVLILATFITGNDLIIIKNELANKYKILMPGVYHQSSVRNIKGLKWLGVFKTDSTHVLEPVELNFKPCPAPSSSRSDDTNGISIAVEHTLNPIFLIHSSQNLEPGSIKTYFDGNKFINAGVLIHLELDCLTALGLVTDVGFRHPGDILTLDYQILLLKYPYARNDRQILIKHERTAGEDTPSLLWAGDLDQDDHIDLLLDISNHYAGRHYVLYLSSEADEGEMVKPVAELMISGC